MAFDLLARLSFVFHLCFNLCQKAALLSTESERIRLAKLDPWFLDRTAFVNRQNRAYFTIVIPNKIPIGCLDCFATFIFDSLKVTRRKRASFCYNDFDKFSYGNPILQFSIELMRKHYLLFFIHFALIR